VSFLPPPFRKFSEEKRTLKVLQIRVCIHFDDIANLISHSKKIEKIWQKKFEQKKWG
jgi:hypothetical protein